MTGTSAELALGREKKTFKTLQEAFDHLDEERKSLNVMWALYHHHIQEMMTQLAQAATKTE